MQEFRNNHRCCLVRQRELFESFPVTNRGYFVLEKNAIYSAG